MSEDSRSLKLEGAAPEPMPKFPSSTLCMAVTALIFGFSCIVYGVIANLMGAETTGATFWVMGALFGIPGLYCGVQLVRALGADDPGERVRILKNLV